MREQSICSYRKLKEADAATLRRTWAKTKGTKPPKTFTSRLMSLALAWDAQEASEGGERAQARQNWNRAIKKRSGGGSTKREGIALYPTISEGTRILKNWGGTTHEVLVTEGGAIWNGESYSSLSSVARAMTGTNRNGPKFFGLREGANL
jgi:hypothetical protein